MFAILIVSLIKFFLFNWLFPNVIIYKFIKQGRPNGPFHTSDGLFLAVCQQTIQSLTSDQSVLNKMTLGGLIPISEFNYVFLAIKTLEPINILSIFHLLSWCLLGEKPLHFTFQRPSTFWSNSCPLYHFNQGNLYFSLLLCPFSPFFLLFLLFYNLIFLNVIYCSYSPMSILTYWFPCS